MPAVPADIGKYTNDGVIITSPINPAESAAIAAEHIDARYTTEAIEMFFDTAADAQAMLDERFEYQSQVGPLHLGIEVAEAIDIGGAIPVAPQVPTFTVVDGDITTVVRTRAYAQDMNTDRFSIEVIE